MARNLTFLHMTDFFPQVRPLVPMTNTKSDSKMEQKSKLTFNQPQIQTLGTGPASGISHCKVNANIVRTKQQLHLRQKLQNKGFLHVLLLRLQKCISILMVPPQLLLTIEAASEV